MIVADAGFETQYARRTFAELRGDAAGFNFHNAQSVGADAGGELSIGGLADVETVEQNQSLVNLGTGDVRLRRLVEHDAGNEVERVTVVASVGVRNVDDVEAAELFLR